MKTNCSEYQRCLMGEKEEENCKVLYGYSPLENGTDYHGQRWISI